MIGVYLMGRLSRTTPEMQFISFARDENQCKQNFFYDELKSHFQKQSSGGIL